MTGTKLVMDDYRGLKCGSGVAIVVQRTYSSTKHDFKAQSYLKLSSHGITSHALAASIILVLDDPFLPCATKRRPSVAQGSENLCQKDTLSVFIYSTIA